MKLSELIKKLQDNYEEIGDVECRYLRLPKVTSIYFLPIKEVYENQDDDGNIYIAIE